MMAARRGIKSAIMIGGVALALPQGVVAGPPFLTDDPEPTELHHWEIYAPLIEGQGQGRDFQGSVGVELNYGAAPNLQLTVGLPIDFAHADAQTRWGAGDVSISAKYRIIHDASAGLQIAVFPGVSLPTGSNGMSVGRITALLPVWVQKDIGPWSMFGGGGYALNPGVGNQNYWTGGAALTRRFGETLLLGVEADRQGADTIGGRASTSLGLGGIYRIKGPLRVLASGGPTFLDDGGAAGFHGFIALGFDF